MTIDRRSLIVGGLAANLAAKAGANTPAFLVSDSTSRITAADRNN